MDSYKNYPKFFSQTSSYGNLIRPTTNVSLHKRIIDSVQSDRFILDDVLHTEVEKHKFHNLHQNTEFAEQPVVPKVILRKNQSSTMIGFGCLQSNPIQSQFQITPRIIQNLKDEMKGSQKPRNIESNWHFKTNQVQSVDQLLNQIKQRQQTQRLSSIEKQNTTQVLLSKAYLNNEGVNEQKLQDILNSNCSERSNSVEQKRTTESIPTQETDFRLQQSHYLNPKLSKNIPRLSTNETQKINNPIITQRKRVKIVQVKDSTITPKSQTADSSNKKKKSKFVFDTKQSFTILSKSPLKHIKNLPELKTINKNQSPFKQSILNNNQIEMFRKSFLNFKQDSQRFQELVKQSGNTTERQSNTRNIQKQFLFPNTCSELAQKMDKIFQINQKRIKDLRTLSTLEKSSSIMFKERGNLTARMVSNHRMQPLFQPLIKISKPPIINMNDYCFNSKVQIMKMEQAKQILVYDQQETQDEKSILEPQRKALYINLKSKLGSIQSSGHSSYYGSPSRNSSQRDVRDNIMHVSGNSISKVSKSPSPDRKLQIRKISSNNNIKSSNNLIHLNADLNMI